MKKVFIILSILTLFSCKKESFLRLNSERLNYEISSEGGKTTLSFSSSEAWTASSSETWVTVSPMKGDAGDNTITVTAGENPRMDGGYRCARIEIRISDKSEIMYIYQGEKKGYVVEQKEYEIGNSGGTLNIPIKSNVTDYSCTVDKSCEEWISVVNTKSLSTNHIRLEISKNTHGEIREGHVTVSYNGHDEVITIKQAEGNELIVTTKTFEIGSDGGEIKVPVSTNKELNINVISGYNWIKAESVQTKSMVDYYIVLSVSPNDTYDGRIGQVKIQSGKKNGSTFELDGNESVITVTQSQKNELVVTRTEYEIGSNGGTISIPVRSNISYSSEVLGDNSWISISSSDTKALETSYVNVSIDKNNTYDARVGQIRIAGDDKESYVTITQNQHDEIIVNNTIYEINSEGGTINIPIESNVQCEAKFTKDYDWIKLENASTKSMESSNLVLKVDANNTYDERIAELLIVGSGKTSISRQIVVTQSQKDDIILPQTEYDVDKMETTISIDIQQNVDYDVHVSCDWITPLETKALQTTTLSFNIHENTTGDERVGEIQIISRDNQIAQTAIIKQSQYHTYKGSFSSLTEKDIKLLRDGGYTKIDGSIKISGGSFSDLDNLIEIITGDLDVYDISNFDGLYGLKAIGGSLYIRFQSDNTRLLSLEGLNNLESIGGDLRCYYRSQDSRDNGKLSGMKDENLEKLSKLQSIGGNLEISLFKYRQGNLLSLKGLENLTSIGKGLHLENVPSLQGLTGITQLENLEIENAADLSGLMNLQYINGNLTLLNGSFDTFYGLNNLRTIGGSLLIKAFIHVGGTFTVHMFSNVTSMAGFDSLNEIGGNLEICSYVDASYGKGYGLNNLENLSGFTKLYKIGGDLKVWAYGGGAGKAYGTPYYSEAHCLNGLKSIDIASLKEIGGNLIIDNAAEDESDGQRYYLIDLCDFSFSSLETIGGDIVHHYKIDHDRYTYKEKEGYSTIKKAPRYLKSVKNIAALCSFACEDDGFVSLVSAGDISGNGIGFPSLKNISNSLTITGSDVNSIGDLKLLETIGGELKISSTSISDISGFNKLSKVGTLVLEKNSNLSDITGFNDLSECSSISISNSPSLHDFSSFVNAVKNGSSWTVSGCGYNPTKYQMQNGQSKQ